MARYPEIRRSIRGTRFMVDHKNPFLEFNLVVSGRATAFVDGRQYDLVPGTLLWILPGHHHRLLRSADFEMWVVIVEPGPYGADFLADLDANPCRLLASVDALELDRLIVHISQDPDQPDVYLPGVDYLIRSARHITLSSPGRARRALHPAVSRTLEILRAESDIPSSAEVARRCGVTLPYLGRLLTEQTGWGFVEWRNRIRIERFTIAWNESHDLMRAAFAAGFGSYTQFHRVFVDLMGCTPGEWSKGESGSAGELRTVADMGSDGEGRRMIWYGLAELVHPCASRWFGAGFAPALQTAGADAQDPANSPETRIDWDRLSDELPAVVAAIEAADPDAGARLRAAVSRVDHIQRFRDTLGLFFPGGAGLAEIVAIYIHMSRYGAMRLAAGWLPELANASRQVHRALAKSGSFARATAAERQLAAAALVAQCSIVLGAIEAARSSGSEKKLARIQQSCRTACLATTGVDVTSPTLEKLFD